MLAYEAWAAYSGSLLGREIEDTEAKFDALSDAEKAAWEVVAALKKEE